MARKFSSTQRLINQITARYGSVQPWALALALPGQKGPERSAEGLCNNSDPQRRLIKRFSEDTQWGQPYYRPTRRGLAELGMDPKKRLAQPPGPEALSRDMAALRFCFTPNTRRTRLLPAEVTAVWEDFPEKFLNRVFVYDHDQHTIAVLHEAGSTREQFLQARLSEEADNLSRIKPLQPVIKRNAITIVVLTYDPARAAAITEHLPKYPKLPISVAQIPFRPWEVPDGTSN